MGETFTEREFVVGLSQEEFTRSQILANNVLRGNHGIGGRLFSVIIMLLCVAMVGMEFRITRQIDPSLAIIMTLMIVAELWFMLDAPRKLRKKNELLYTMSRFSGHSFDGVATVNEFGVTKCTVDERTHVGFSQCAAYIETEDMLMFCMTQGKSIVIPARCLTAEDAEYTKKAAFAVVSPTKRYVLAQISPKLENKQPIGNILKPMEVEEMLRVRVEYTAAELKSGLTDTAVQNFFENFSQKMLVAVFFTILFYFTMEMMPLPFFLMSLVVLFLSDIITVRMRARRAIRVSDGDVCRVQLILTEQYLQITGKSEHVRRMKVPWECITRAVERPKEVEFYAQTRILTVPKRCIEDMDELRTIVDRCMKK